MSRRSRTSKTILTFHCLRDICFVLLLDCLLLPLAQSAESPQSLIKILKDVPYTTQPEISEYQKERCKLDLYLPAGQNRFATLVWFHGGALKEGRKDDEFTVKICRQLAESGVAVAAANYRLSPRTLYPGYLEDAAAAFTWVQHHITEYGGDVNRIFVGGHSAGGYITYMIGLDGRYLKKHGLEISAIAGLIPVSGQTMTHYTIREERSLPKDTIIADQAAPIHYAAKSTPPILVLYADHDMAARSEENQYMVAALKAAGNERVHQLEIKDRDHGSVAGKMAQPGDPATKAILEFMTRNATD
jgi:acetyl esterase/lipase